MLNKYKLNNKNLIKKHFDKLSVKRKFWINKSKGFYSEDIKYMRELIPQNSKILEIGCGNGNLVATLEPSVGVGIDISEGMIKEAKKQYDNIDFIVADVENKSSILNLKQIFDYIIISDTIGYFNDIESTFNALHKVCNADTRIIVAYYSPFWEPILNIAAKLKLKMSEFLYTGVFQQKKRMALT